MRWLNECSAAETYEICHRLVDDDLTSELLTRLREIQLHRNQLLVEAVRRQVRGTDADAAFRALAELQESDPRLMAELLVLPQVGCWAVDCLRRLRDGEDPDLGYLVSFSAGAALRAGRRPPLSPGAFVPGLGTFAESGLAPIPTLHAQADGLGLAVRLDAVDPYLAGFGRRGEADPVWWQRELGRAWQVLCERHHHAAGTIAAVFTTLVPLEGRDRARPASATSGWAYGAIALSPPPDPVAFAESLVHEVWHLVLGAVEDMVELTGPDDGRRWYAPWRSDPRPLGALLQGCFANFAITAFWRAERHANPPVERHASPADERHASPAVERAEAEFAYRRAITFEALTRASGSEGLTGPGEVLVNGLLGRLGEWLHEPVPASAERRAAELRDGHRARWRSANPGFSI
ncbi:HEXXH motif-containing putative peptide modification protein [Nonomuraea angiospora]|uniref:aKG-HExxH-type peptide beta-hydroxylase n=1 Tax=Nonomuraea angiospora TaxID=46172 RepID=UPI0033260B52